MIDRRSFLAALPAAAPPSGVLEALQAWRKATLAADRAALDRLLDDELLFGHSNGRLESKREFINALASGNPHYEAIEIGEQTVKVHGAAAVTRGPMTIRIVRDNQANTYKLNVLHVWILADGSWRLVARQATRL